MRTRITTLNHFRDDAGCKVGVSAITRGNRVRTTQRRRTKRQKADALTIRDATSCWTPTGGEVEYLSPYYAREPVEAYHQSYV